MTSSNSPNSSSDNYYYLPYTLPVHLPGLVSTNPADSPHMPLPQKAVPPEVPGYTDIQPERVGTDLGMETSFKIIPNDYEVLKDMILMVHWAPLVAGAGGNSPRYPDDPSLACMEYIQFQIGGATISQKTGDEIRFDNEVNLAYSEKQRRATAQCWITDDTTRASATWAANPNGFWTFTEVPMWWSDTAAKNWHQYACQRQTRINVKWRSVEYCLQQNGANTQPTTVNNTTYIMEVYLRFRTSALDTAVKDTYVNAVKSQGSNGLNYLLQFTQIQENQLVAAGTPQTMSIQLTNFNKPTYMLRFVVRNQNDMAANYMTGNHRFLKQTVTSYQADASGHRLWPRMSDAFAKLMVNNKEFLGENPTDYNVYHVLHTDYADVTQYPMGCVEYGKLQNPTITLYWDALLNNSRVDVWAHAYDYIRLVITQDNRSAVNLEQPI